MSYISKAELERARWWTLCEAIDVIAAREHCEHEEALRQWQAAMLDEEISWKWGDADSNWIERRNMMLHRRWFWERARVNLEGDGRVFDDDGLSLAVIKKEGKARFRPVLVSREDVDRHWPEQVDANENDLSNEGKGPRETSKTTTDEAIRKCLQEIYQDPANDRPNMNEVYPLVRERLPRDRFPMVNRSRVWTIVREEQFRGFRRDRGERRK
jgi:hypothetical protein